MSWSRRTVAHGSCVRSADELSVKSRHWVVAGRHRPTTVRCSVRRQDFGAARGRSAAGKLKPARPLGGRAVGRGAIGWDGTHPRDRASRSSGQVRGRRARAARARADKIGEAGEVGGSGVRRTSSALFGFEQTVGIDLSLERRPEGEPGGLGRLARVVGRVESVCTDPAAKGPTGPFCLVHLQMLPVPSAASAAFLARPHRVRAPALLGQPSARSIAEPLFWSSPRLLLSRAWGRAQEAERERSDPTPSSAGPQGIVYNIVYCVPLYGLSLQSRAQNALPGRPNGSTVRP